MSLLKKIYNRLWTNRPHLRSRLRVDSGKTMHLALDISGCHVMCFDLRRNTVFDLHGKSLFGNHVGMDICYTYVHPDDLPVFRSYVERMSLGQLKEAEFRYRWDFNYTGHGRPDWHDMHCVAVAEFVGNGTHPANIIATVKDETEVVRKHREAKHLMERYRIIFENSIIGLSFYSPEGYLITANRLMREICNFDSETGDDFFSHANLFDVMPFDEVLDRHHVEEKWFCSLSVIPERNMHVYLEIRVHPVYDKDGQLAYISVATRDITQERELYHQIRDNDVRLQQVNESIQLYESELRYMMDACNMRFWRLSFADRKIRFYHGLSEVVREMTLEELAPYFVDDESHIREVFEHPEDFFSRPVSRMFHSRRDFSDTDELTWNQIDGIPVTDEQGRITGCFGLVRNVSDLMRQQELLKEETERANQSGQLKSIFLANMTHEIRTPLNAIVGFSDVLSMLSTTDEKKEVIKVIMSNCDMLLRLVNDILTASSLESQGVQIVAAKVDFAKAFSELCSMLAPRIQQPEVEFRQDCPMEHFVTMVDMGRVSQLVTNYFTNAVKYTHQGHITLGWRLQEREGIPGIYIYCEDTGEGIAPEVQPQVFDRFFKVNDYIQGTGLGLAICKAIAEACHGSVGVQSEGKDQGSTFWMWLPAEMLKEEC